MASLRTMTCNVQDLGLQIASLRLWSMVHDKSNGDITNIMPLTIIVDLQSYLTLSLFHGNVKVISVSESWYKSNYHMKYDNKTTTVSGMTIVMTFMAYLNHFSQKTSDTYEGISVKSRILVVQFYWNGFRALLR